MKTLVFIAGSFFICATLATAQFAPEAKYDPASVSALVDRVHADLNQAYGVRHFSDSDRDRLNHSEKELRDFAQKWQAGHFDKGQLDGAVESIQHVLDNNKIRPGERDVLSDDVAQLRLMRDAHDRHEIEGDRH